MHTEREIKAAREYAKSLVCDHDNIWDRGANAKVETKRKIIEEHHLAGIQWWKDNAWILVSENGLPDKGERVQVFGNEIGIPSWAFWINEHGEWVNAAGIKYGKNVITHYQYLPPPPQQ